MKKIICILCVAVFTAVMLMPVFGAQKQEARLTLKKDGSFTILHLTDSQDDQNPAWDMLNLIQKSIEESKPDLIVFTGDLVEDSRIGDLGIDREPLREGVCAYTLNNEIDHDKTLKNIRVSAGAVLDILEASGVPYILTQGNNDYKCTITNEEWLAIYAEYPNCLVTDMSDDAEGRIDSYLLIYDNEGNPVYNIWCMDSGRGGINADQLLWYRETEQTLTLQYGKTIPSVWFQHIQIADIGNLFTECSVTDEGATYHDGKFYRLNPETAVGDNYYAYEPGNTSEVFTAWCEMGDVKAAYFGHQHKDGFTGTVNGIELGFTYGCEMAKAGPHGYRTVILTQTEQGVKLNSELYRYTGYVKLGTDKITKQENTVKEYTPVQAALQKAVNMFKALFSMITTLF